MGEPRIVFKRKVEDSVVGMILGFLLGVAGAALIIVGIVLVFLHHIGFRPGFLLLVPGGVLLVLFGRFLIGHSRRNLSLRVAIFSDGLVRIRHRTVDICSWDEIESVYQSWPLNIEHLAVHLRDMHSGGYSLPHYVCTIHRRDGKKFVFDELIKNVVKLGELIQQEAMRCLLPRALARFQEGKRVTFGTIAVDQKGFTSGNAFLPWGEVVEVKLAQGGLMVSKEGKWFSWCKVSAASIPNLFVLLALLYKSVGLRSWLKVDGYLPSMLVALLDKIVGVER
jgi:hypothetical protein